MPQYRAICWVNLKHAAWHAISLLLLSLTSTVIATTMYPSFFKSFTSDSSMGPGVRAYITCVSTFFQLL